MYGRTDARLGGLILQVQNCKKLLLELVVLQLKLDTILEFVARLKYKYYYSENKPSEIFSLNVFPPMKAQWSAVGLHM
jgi:hypothetical protein